MEKKEMFRKNRLEAVRMNLMGKKMGHERRFGSMNGGKVENEEVLEANLRKCSVSRIADDLKFTVSTEKLLSVRDLGSPSHHPSLLMQTRFSSPPAAHLTWDKILNSPTLAKHKKTISIRNIHTVAHRKHNPFRSPRARCYSPELVTSAGISLVALRPNI